VAKCKPEELFLLRVLSCFDAPVSLDLLRQIAPFNPSRVRDFLDLLMNVGMLHSILQGNRWFFSQSRFKEFVYDSLGNEKPMLHTLIADTMAASAGTAAEFAEVIAHHYKAAGSGRSAYPFFLAAAEQKRSHYALHESLVLLNEACSLIPHEEIDVSVFEDLAECYSLAGEYPNAILLYEQLRIDAADEGKRYKYAKELGSIYNREGRIDEAYGLLLEAADLARTPGEIIEVEEELSIIDISRGKYAEAFERSNRVLLSHGGAVDPTATTGILNNLGIIHFYRNDADAAAECFRRSIGILQSAHEKAKLISPYLNLGNVYSAKEEFSEAARHWKIALALTQEVGNVQQEARAYNNIGIAAFHQGNNDDASLHYEKAYEIFSRLGSVPGMALCLTNIGEVHCANAHYEKAIECWEEDLRLYETLHDEHGMIEIRLLLAGISIVFGRWDAAQTLIDAAGASLAGVNNPAQQALFHSTQASLYASTGNHEAALPHCTEAVTIFTGAGDRRSLCLVQLTLAEVEHALGRSARSAALLTDVNTCARDRQYGTIRGEALLRLGLLSGQDSGCGLDAPITYFTAAFDVVQTLNVTETTWNVCYRLGTEYTRRGMHAKAETYFRYAIQAVEFLASEISSEGLRREYMGSLSRQEKLDEMRSLIGAGVGE
jgi:tetratricopeptide (TPR) repeat protein